MLDAAVCRAGILHDGRKRDLSELIAVVKPIQMCGTLRAMGPILGLFFLLYLEGPGMSCPRFITGY